MKPEEIYFVYRNRKFVSTVPSLPVQKYGVYYHPVHDLLGLDVGNGLIRVYIFRDTRTFVGKTDMWTKIGEL